MSAAGDWSRECSRSCVAGCELEESRRALERARDRTPRRAGSELAQRANSAQARIAQVLQHVDDFHNEELAVVAVATAGTKTVALASGPWAR